MLGVSKCLTRAGFDKLDEGILLFFGSGLETPAARESLPGT
jgi:hypothetical protein